YMATLPPHWNTQNNPQKFEELHSWIAGQFTTSAQALKVLEARAKAAASKSDNETQKRNIVTPAWPELAEYDCFSCLHGLSDSSWRHNVSSNAAPQQSDRPARKPGAPAWGTWYFAGPRMLAGTPALASDSTGNDFRQRLNDLTVAMQTSLPY